jgi:hypothetical protein
MDENAPEARPMNRNSIVHGGRAIALAAIVTSSALACQAQATKPVGIDEAGPPAAHDAVQRFTHRDVMALAANARAATRNHDQRMLHLFRVALTKRVGAEAVQRVRADYRRLIADLGAADANHDSRARAHFLDQLRTLCDEGGLAAAFEACQADLAAYGR